MKIVLLACALLICTAYNAQATMEADFSQCENRSGVEYLASRDRLLVTPQIENFIAEKLKSLKWNERVTARILKGWLANAANYRAMLAAPKVTDRAGISRYQWELKPGSVDASAIPLLYELLLKQTTLDAEWDAALAIVQLARRNEVELDLAALHKYYQSANFLTENQHLATAWLLGNLPATYQKNRETNLIASLKSELSNEKPSKEAISSLFIGLSRAAQSLDSADRDGIVDEIDKFPKLQSKLGPKLLTHAVGSIGGDKASQRVAAYLNKTEENDVLEKRWALVALSQSASSQGTKTLLDYVNDPHDEISQEAIRGLAYVPYDEKVSEKLSDLASNQDLPKKTQLQAVRSLAQIIDVQRNNPQIAQKVRIQLQNVSGKNPNMQQAIKKALEDLRE